MAQVQSGNYPIPDDTGANFRADVNENLAALNSNNSGSNEPTIKLAHQFFVDESTTPDTLRIRNASNNGYIELGKLETDLGHMPKSGGSFTGSTSFASGTAGSPSIQLNDADTGLFLSSANNIGITTGGTTRLNIDSNGLTVNAGKELRLKDPQDNNFLAIKAPALSADLTFTLPDNDGNAGDKLESDGSGNLSWQPVQGVPTGSVHVMATTNVPSGYLECAGQSLSRTTYANLFAAITTTWGSVDSQHFNLPDMRGQFVRGWVNTKTGTNDDGRSFANAQTSRNKTHNHSASTSISDSGHFHQAFRSGNHGERRTESNLTSSNFAGSGSGAGHLNEAYNITATNSVANVGKTSNNTTGISASTTTGNEGGSDARPDNIAMMYVIKT
nr:phage tail fiber protein [uncultured Mediterranean phage uvMED]BAR26517.1 phage tail fiber protein [uncultured Mediterranean phage uvMED]